MTREWMKFTIMTSKLLINHLQMTFIVQNFKNPAKRCVGNNHYDLSMEMFSFDLK